MSFEQRVVQLEETNAELVKEVVRVRDAAMGLNRMYPTVTEGRQTVNDGEYFVVPGDGTYARLYRRNGSQAQLIAEFPSRAVLDGAIAALENSDSRYLIKDGEGGIQHMRSPGRWNDNFTTGDSILLRGTGDEYEGIGTYGGALCFSRVDTSSRRRAAIAAVQSGSDINQTGLVFFINGQTTTANDSISRRGFFHHTGSFWVGGDIFANWNLQFEGQQGDLVYHQGNILGSVSQSGGTPSGAVIERGSNSNGEYVKFADGTLICTHALSVTSIDTPLGALYRSASVEWEFPSGFLGGAPVCAGFGGNNANGIMVTRGADNTTTGNGRFYLIRTAPNTGATFSFSVNAIGRWH